MKKILMCASLLALSLSASASTADTTRAYIRADISGARHKMSGIKKYHAAPSYNIGIGYKFDDNFRSDVNFKLLNSKLPSLRSKIRTKAVFLNGYYDFKNDSVFTPYLTAGIGAAKNTVKIDTTQSKSKINFVWNAGLGSKINMTTNLDLDVSYKYSALGKPIKDSDNTAKKLHAHEVALGLIYNF